MIVVMNIIISLIGLGGIIMARHLIRGEISMGIKSHLLILASKLFVTSVIIALSLMYAEKHIWSLLIISGMINIIIFHFIEAFATQAKLLQRKVVNV